MLVRSKIAATKTYSMDIWIRELSDFYLVYCKNIFMRQRKETFKFNVNNQRYRKRRGSSYQYNVKVKIFILKTIILLNDAIVY